MDYHRLGKSDLVVSSVGLGTWQWGSRRYWGYGKSYGKEDVIRIKDKAIELGINLFDTAELYGRGMSEELMGEIMPKENGIVVATKYWPFRLTSNSVFKSVEKSLHRLSLKTIDLYQVHWSNPTNSLGKLMRNMERLIRDGKIRYIGLSNFSVKGVEEAQSYLSFADIVSNQVPYSLISREPERNGLVDYCSRNRIAIIAWSPLEQGLLTGKYRPGMKSSGLRRLRPAFSQRNLRKLKPFMDTVEAVSVGHSKTPAQCALNWLLRRDNVVVIPGASSPKQVEENCGAVGWSMTDEDVQRLQRAYLSYRG